MRPAGVLGSQEGGPRPVTTSGGGMGGMPVGHGAGGARSDSKEKETRKVTVSFAGERV